MVHKFIVQPRQHSFVSEHLVTVHICRESQVASRSVTEIEDVLYRRSDTATLLLLIVHLRLRLS